MNAPAPRDSLTNGRTPSALPLGTRLGEFELKKVLGIGGFGIVYLAFDHLLEREVALKEYMPQSLVDRTATMHVSLRSSSDADVFAAGLKSFVNEARLLAHFNHPSLLKVHRFWEANGTAYMAMPMYRGRTLKEVADALGQAPSEAWLQHVLAPLLGALELMHREGVYHRDISPDNILIEDDGNPVLLDFGAARRVIADRSQNLTAILKPSYAPIEQYAETSAIRQGPWTDLYALGATLHFLLLGRPPPPSTTRSIHDEMLPLAQQPLNGISLAFLSAIDWMLRPRPADRPPSVAVARDALEGRIAVPPEGEQTVIVRSPAPARAAMPGRGADDDDADDEMTVTRPLAEPLPPTQFLPRKSAPPITTSSRTKTQPVGRPATASQATQPRTQPATQPPKRSPEPTPAPGLADDDDVTVIVQREPRAMPSARGSRRRSSAAAARRLPLLLGLAIGGGAILVALFWWVLQRPAAQPGAPARAEAASAARTASASVAASPPAVASGTAAAISPLSNAATPAQPQGAATPAAGSARVAATPASAPSARPAAPAKTAAATPAPPPAQATPTPAATTPTAAQSGQTRPASAQAPGPAVVPAAAQPPNAVTTAGDGPRARCGNRTFLALFTCMREECARPQWREHPECAQWRPDARPSNPDSQ